MAAGDAYIVSPVSVADTAFLDLQPTSSVEVVIHNINVPEGTKIELVHYDGTDSITVWTGYGSLWNMQLHATDTVYYRVKNISGAAKILSAEGMVTK